MKVRRIKSGSAVEFYIMRGIGHYMNGVPLPALLTKSRS